ncbi:nuclear transport factor 2 family protein [Sediminibacterium ginsengisoli]|uniref:DUF4440 domain-containing protein n=1 Tax=Sediminibacterium ginsengisoli TaxID=413434 RepID=A0A1T4M8D9_9BACT|nr:nuclear transport factor 2 family protein [Sediminibacterium ginsengisoli]SJZ63107.1 protein of unknown function [Sediminibacterium ginsengisoli]
MLKYIILITFCFFAEKSIAQVSKTDTLYKKVTALDSLVFTEGFNRCNLGVYDNIIAEDLEFYHDKGGITSGKAAFVASVKNNICNSKTPVKRTLDSMQVYTMQGNGQLYGAVQEGIHSFYHWGNNTWVKSGDARFLHVWLLDKGSWLLKRVVSYDH